MAKRINMGADAISQKWQRNSAAAGPAIQAGVQAVTENPATKAAARADQYVAGVQRAVATGKWQAGLGRVTLEAWKQAMIQKGIPRQAQGVAQAGPKFTAFMTQFIPFINQGLAQLQSTPRGTLEENLNRANIMARYLATFRRGGGMVQPMMPFAGP